MTELMRALSERLKAALATHALLCAEADLAALDAERRAGLLRQAGTLEAEGHGALAVNLRDVANKQAGNGADALAAKEAPPALPAPAKRGR